LIFFLLLFDKTFFLICRLDILCLFVVYQIVSTKLLQRLQIRKQIHSFKHHPVKTVSHNILHNSIINFVVGQSIYTVLLKQFFVNLLQLFFGFSKVLYSCGCDFACSFVAIAYFGLSLPELELCQVVNHESYLVLVFSGAGFELLLFIQLLIDAQVLVVILEFAVTIQSFDGHFVES